MSLGRWRPDSRPGRSRNILTSSRCTAFTERYTTRSPTLPSTDIAKIEIVDGEVVMTTRSNGLRFVVDPSDQRTTPVEILNFGSYESIDGDTMLALRPDVERVTVHLETLDAMATNVGGNIDFVKCDVESAELFALRGARETLVRDRPALFVELLRKWAAPFGYHPNGAIDLLEGIGYRTFVSRDAGRPASFGRVAERTVAANYVFLHPTRHQSVIDRLVH